MWPDWPLLLSFVRIEGSPASLLVPAQWERCAACGRLQKKGHAKKKTHAKQTSPRLRRPRTQRRKGRNGKGLAGTSNRGFESAWSDAAENRYKNESSISLRPWP